MALKKKQAIKTVQTPCIRFGRRIGRTRNESRPCRTCGSIDAKAGSADRKHANTQSCREGVLRTFRSIARRTQAEKRRWLTGALCGVVYIVISLAVFGLASGEFSIGSSTAVDALMCLLAGMTGGIILSLAE